MIKGYEDLKKHIGHDIELAYYGELPEPDNIAIECLTCMEVLIDFDHPEINNPDLVEINYLDRIREERV